MAWSNLTTKNTGDTIAAADVNTLMENARVLGGNGTSAPSTDIETLNTTVGQNTPPGALIMYGAAAAPTGWLLCNGAAVSRSTYSALFAIIDTTYGVGDGSTTFNLPDFRGIFPKGAGTTDRAAGKDAANNFYTATLGTYSQDKMQGHYHASNAMKTPTSGGYGQAGTDIGNAADILAPETDGTNGTPRTGTLTEPQNLGISFIIKY